MKQPNTLLLAQYRRFKQLGSWLKKGRLSRFSLKKRMNLERQLGDLFKKLQSYVPGPQLVKAAGISLALMSGIALNAQTTFGPGQTNPMGLVNQGGFAFINTADIDGDGDQDMVVSSDYNNGMIYYENTGSATAPQFDTVEVAIQGLGPITTYATRPSFVDLDYDGDLDLLGYQYDSYGNSGFFFQENTGTAASPTFAAATMSPFGLSGTATAYINTVFADMDADGDQDMFTFEVYPSQSIKYYENTGTISAPLFASPITTPFQIQVPTQPGLMTVGDVDRDGDIDMFINGFGGNFQYSENTGTPQLPSFDATINNPFGLTALGGGYFAFPWMTDIDADGDLDMFAINDTGDFIFFENEDATVGTTATQAQDLSFQLSPNPAFDLVQLNINAPVDASDVLIQVIALNGQVLQQGLTNLAPGQQVVQVSVSDLPAGLYAIRIEHKGKQFSQKFVKAN